MIKLKILRNDIILASFEQSLMALSSTVFGGGFRELKYVIFKRVEKDFRERDPRKYALEVIKEVGSPPPLTAVFLTSANIVKDHFILKSKGPPEENVLLTLGLKPPSCIERPRIQGSIGTVNILLTVNECLTTEAVTDLVMLTGGVKSAAFSDLGISCEGFKRAYSTVTDAIIVAYRSRDCRRKISYGGPATSVGNIASKLIYEALMRAVLNKLDIRDLLKYYTSFTDNEIVELGFKIYKEAAVPGVSDEKVKNLINEKLKNISKDPNLWALLRSAQSLSFYGHAGVIPGLSEQEYIKDSKKIVADELLGIALSIYINGWKGMFNYYWIDRVKERFKEFRSLPMFIDDVVAALIGGVLSEVYDELLKERGRN